MSAGMLATVYPPLSPAKLLRPSRVEAAFPFDQHGTTLTHLGRGAVWLALKALGLGAGKRLAMPAYHCGSEVEAAHLAGLQISFYRVDRDLRVDLDDLTRVATECDALYLISHFGFPIVASPVDKPLVEDAAHALFSNDGGTAIGSRGDAAIFCPRKSLGVPDGGALLLGDGNPVSTESGRPGRREMLRSIASLVVARAATARVPGLRQGAAGLLSRASRGDAAAREGTLTETVIGEWGLQVGDMEAAARAPTSLTRHICRRANADRIRARRRRNYELLLAGLADHVPEPFRKLPAGVAPLYFPVSSPDRNGAIRRLLALGVRSLEIWPVPHPLLDRDRFRELEPARRELLALPVHQSLGTWQMQRVLSAAKSVL